MTLVPDNSFSKHPGARRWLRIIDRNLCWSGVFLITDSRYRTCRSESGNQVDMKILLKLKSKLSQSGTFISKKLILTVADNDGVPLFPLDLALRKDRFRESELMKLINKLSAQLTGLGGVLGSTIAFTLKQPERRKIIARVNTHGKKLAAVSKNSSISLLPSWSPKGNSIVYTTLSRRGTAIIYNDLKDRPVKLLRSSTSATSMAKNYLSVSGGTWYSNGRKLVVTLSRKGNSDLYSFDRQKRKVTRLTTHRAIDTVPDLSPDDQHLIFVSDRSGHEQIFYLKLGTKIPFQLTFGRGSSSDPVWSPDGTLIAFSKISSGHSQIHLMDPFTGEDHTLTRGRYNSEQPAWSPDGRQIAFVSSSTGVDKLYIMFVDGSGRRRLTRTPKEFEEGAPTWTARKF
ncbi:MAG: PD40 domain-containing protein [SAR324 cluster bacterium]|nr:PD40 domain-containing protein [SAR324 cluster bacterium]MBL7036123.1 PD40 domain-containing protein [SAR324 cluster bacterium]